MNIAANSGNGEGLLAWRRLLERNDSAAIPRLLAGLLLSLMIWDVRGEVQGRMDLFEPEVLRDEVRAKELNIRMGMDKGEPATLVASALS